MPNGITAANATHWVIPKWVAALASFTLFMFVPWLAWVSGNLVELKTHYCHAMREHAQMRATIENHSTVIASMRCDIRELQARR